jgi:hypothetical protein
MRSIRTKVIHAIITWLYSIDGNTGYIAGVYVSGRLLAQQNMLWFLYGSRDKSIDFTAYQFYHKSMFGRHHDWVLGKKGIKLFFYKKAPRPKGREGE